MTEIQITGTDTEWATFIRAALLTAEPSTHNCPVDLTTPIIAQIRSQARTEALEEAARVAETEYSGQRWYRIASNAGIGIAASIRALAGIAGDTRLSDFSRDELNRLWLGRLDWRDEDYRGCPVPSRHNCDARGNLCMHSQEEHDPARLPPEDRRLRVAYLRWIAGKEAERRQEKDVGRSGQNPATFA